MTFPKKIHQKLAFRDEIHKTDYVSHLLTTKSMTTKEFPSYIDGHGERVVYGKSDNETTEDFLKRYSEQLKNQSKA